MPDWSVEFEYQFLTGCEKCKSKIHKLCAKLTPLSSWDTFIEISPPLVHYPYPWSYLFLIFAQTPADLLPYPGVPSVRQTNKSTRLFVIVIYYTRIVVQFLYNQNTAKYPGVCLTYC